MKAQVLNKYDDELTADHWVDLQDVEDLKIEKATDVIVWRSCVWGSVGVKSLIDLPLITQVIGDRLWAMGDGLGKRTEPCGQAICSATRRTEASSVSNMESGSFSIIARASVSPASNCVRGRTGGHW